VLSHSELERCRATWRAKQRQAAAVCQERWLVGRRLAGEMAGLVRAVAGVRRVWLVGSLVEKDRFHARSDIDLVVEGLPGERYMEVLTEIYDRLPSGWDLDLIRIEELPEPGGRDLVARGEEMG